jgi:2-alkenal reductase
LNVTPFGDDTALHASDPIFLSDAAMVLTVSVLEARRLPVATKIDYIESSERLGRRIMIDKAGPAGAATVNANGETVGVSLGDGTAVPASFVTQVLRDLFKDGKIIRPAIGVRFVSLDVLPNAKDAGLPSTGALLIANGKYSAVAKGSAAEIAGLREGDVITAVEHDRINNEETLSERLQDYAPGARVELTVIRAGKTLKIELTLK